jgi:hypothetical protein
LFVFATLATHLPLTLYLSCIHQVRSTKLNEYRVITAI